jgi:NAD(P)-dependent dehydrogenase (short-subunit alcohol dehydrogenase family)
MMTPQSTDMETSVDELAGRAALVTGAGRGIGRAIVEALIARGAKVAVNVRDEPRAKAAAEAAGSRAIPAAGDVGDPAAVERIVRTAVEAFGRLDILVNNAAVATGTRLPALGLEEWRRTFDVNVTAPFLFLKAALPIMQSQRYGRIINIASTAGKTVSTLGGAHYTASKHALLGLTRAAARELGPLGITVNAVCPGMTDTELVTDVASPALVKEIIETRVPIRRLGTPAEVADFVGYLASERSGYINGASLDINGGIILI